VVVTGQSSPESIYSYDGSREQVTNFVPEWFNAAPPLIEVSREVPAKIMEPLRLAFSAFWADPSACAARCRIAIERLLDHLKVRRTHIVKSKRVRISLHHRIELLSGTRDDLKELLFAAKWLGNEGAHDMTLTRADAIDALDIVERALDDVFDAQLTHVQKTARQIVKTKRARSKVKK
jgi:hypothetical protein